MCEVGWRSARVRMRLAILSKKLVAVVVTAVRMERTVVSETP